MIRAILSDPKKMLTLVASASLFMMGAALFFEYVMALHPCRMCIWQRIPHIVVIGLGGISLLSAARPFHRPILGLMSIILLIGAGLAFWHSGVELKLLEGLSSCSAALSLSGDSSALLDQILAAPTVRCDEVPWSFLALSIANWNFLISFAMAVTAMASVIKAKTPMDRIINTGDKA